MVHKTITRQVHLYSTPESAHARGQIKWDLGIISPHSASLLHTLGQHGFPDSQLQCQTPWWGGVKGPNLPWPVLSLKGLTVNGHQNAKIFSKKCSFHLRSKILPQSMTTFWAFLSILSVPWRKGGQNTGSTTILTTPRVVSAPWFTLYDPQILVIMYTQSSKCWWVKCRVENARRLPQGLQWPGPWRRPHSHLQQETIVPNVQQNVSLWKTAPGLQGLGDSFIRPYIFHCLLEKLPQI